MIYLCPMVPRQVNPQVPTRLPVVLLHLTMGLTLPAQLTLANAVHQMCLGATLLILIEATG